MTQKIKQFQMDLETELILPGDPTSLLGAVTKQYVDDSIIASSSYTNSGYVNFGDGLILQWGSVMVTSSVTGVTQTIATYPIVFPNNVFSITIGHNQGSPVARAGSVTPFISFFDTSQVNLGLDDSNIIGSATFPVYYMAIGH